MIEICFSSILISDDVKRRVEHDFIVECVEFGCWTILQARTMQNGNSVGTPLSHSLLFAATQRRFSLVALPQAISRLLQSFSVVNAAAVAAGNTLKIGRNAANEHILFKSGTNAGRRKKYKI